MLEGKITNEDLINLQGLKNLESLELSYAKITDAGLVYLQELKNLRHLFLPRISDDGSEKLRQALPNCGIVHVLVSDDAEAHYNLGVVYGNLDRWNEAVESCKQAIRINPDYAEAHCFLGMAYLAVGDKNAALNEYKILKDLSPVRAKELFDLIYK